MKNIKIIPLPKCVGKLAVARDQVRYHFRDTGLPFTLDGRLVGDVGEAVIAQAFDLVLCSKRTKGVDAHTRIGKSVQIKATGNIKKGPAYSRGDATADFLIFVHIDFEQRIATIIYNGPEAPVRKMVPNGLKGTKRLPLRPVRELDEQVIPEDRLPMLQLVTVGGDFTRL